MKKYLTAFLIVVSCNFCFAQGAKFQLFLTKACTTVEKLDTSYYLMPLSNPDTAYFPKKGTVYLPTKGKYVIGFNAGPILDSSLIEIKDSSLFVYRYKESKIQRYLSEATDTPPVYVVCDSLINGYAEDFYPNGNLKIRGDFKNGHPKDSIITFYTTGQIEKRINILPKVVNIEEYDSSGNLIKLSHNQNKSFMTYWEYRWIEFYPNGKIKSTESSIKRITNIEEYYPNEQLKVKQAKKYRTEYYENGSKSITYTWKYKSDRSDYEHPRDFTIYKNEYDKNGQLLQSAIFEYWHLYGSQPHLDIYRSDWLVSVTKYKGGKKFFMVKDMDTKEYLKKYHDDTNIVHSDRLF